MDLNYRFQREPRILGQNSRMNKAGYQQLKSFPFYLVGWIKSAIINPTNNKNLSKFKGTGFLIAERLVVTSAFNSIIVGNDGEAENDTNIYFCTLQLQGPQLVQKKWKVKAIRLHSTFQKTLSMISFLERMLSEQYDSFRKYNFCSQIDDLKRSIIPYDYALLVLGQPIIRPEYFELSTDLKQHSKLTVAGCISINNRLDIFSHSNFYDQIHHGGVSYDIYAAFGQCGSPVYTTQHQHKVVAIHIAYDAVKKLNFAFLVSKAMIQKVKEWAWEYNLTIKQEVEYTIPGPIQQADRNINQGKYYLAIGETEKALFEYLVAELHHQNLNKPSAQYAQTLYNIGCLYSHQAKKCLAKRYFFRAYQICQKKGQVEEIDLFITKKLLSIFMARGYKQLALTYQQKINKIEQYLDKKKNQVPGFDMTDYRVNKNITKPNNTHAKDNQLQQFPRAMMLGFDIDVGAAFNQESLNPIPQNQAESSQQSQ